MRVYTNLQIFGVTANNYRRQCLHHMGSVIRGCRLLFHTRHNQRSRKDQKSTWISKSQWNKAVPAYRGVRVQSCYWWQQEHLPSGRGIQGQPHPQNVSCSCYLTPVLLVDLRDNKTPPSKYLILICSELLSLFHFRDISFIFPYPEQLKFFHTYKRWQTVSRKRPSNTVECSSNIFPLEKPVYP